jgi:D-apiose dehydrogenase
MSNLRVAKAAIIGCGFFSPNHFKSWRELSDRVALVAVCDLDADKARAAAARFDIPKAYTDVTELLNNEALDFVDVVTTAPSHREIVERCAEAGVAAIVQKPLAPSWGDAAALASAMAKAGKPLMVHENFRFQRPLRRAIEIIKSGAIGNPVWGRFSFRTGYDIYSGQPYLAEVERFILLDLGIHVLDVARAFMGEADEVFCRTQSVRPGIRGEDVATVMVAHRTGATSVVDLSYASKLSPDPFPQTLGQVEGTLGSVRLEDRFRLTVTTPERAWSEDVPPHPLSWGTEAWLLVQESVLATQRHWIDCLEKQVEPETSGRDNLRTFALVEAAYESAASGKPVKPVEWIAKPD